MARRAIAYVGMPSSTPMNTDTGGTLKTTATRPHVRRNLPGRSARALQATTVDSGVRSPSIQAVTGRSSLATSLVAKMFSIATTTSAATRMRRNCSSDIST